MFTKEKILSFLPFVETIKNYSKGKFNGDLVAGLTVAIVAIPQSMAYAMIAGVDPRLGLYATIAPVIVSSLFGSSNFLIAGPTNAIAMVVFSSISTTVIGKDLIINLDNEQKIGAIFLLAFLVGLIQFVMGAAKLGNLVNFISHSVVVGFTAGAGILIAFNQLKNFLGLKFTSHPEFIHTFEDTFRHIGDTNKIALYLGLFTVAFILIGKRISKKIPGALLSMISAAILVAIFNLDGAVYKLELVGTIPQSLPPLSIMPFSFDMIRALFMPALAIAVLGSVEALSIAKSIASKSREKIDGSQEFIAQGLANIAAGFFSGIPGSGSFTRSAVNYDSGAKTRFAGVYSAIFILATILAFAPLARFIPKTSLAAILMIIAYNMIDRKEIISIWKTTKSDAAVMTVTMLSTLLLELEKAVFVGVLLSIALFLRKVSRPQIKQVCPRESDNRMAEMHLVDKKCPQISIYQIDGPLFFGAINDLCNQLCDINVDGVHVVIVRMRGVHLVDATGIHALEMFMRDMKGKNTKVIFTNVTPEVLKVLKSSGVLDKIGADHIQPDTTASIKFACDRYVVKAECANCQQKIFRECIQ